MSNGQWLGQPGDARECWIVELPDFRGIEFVHAERVRIDGGALIFTDGKLPDVILVGVYGPQGFMSSYRAKGCDHGQESDDE